MSIENTAIILGFFMVMPVLAFAQDVVVETDKGLYHQGDQIKIRVKNNSPESIFSIAASLTPVFSIDSVERKNKNGEFEKLSIRCEWPECDSDFDGPAEIKPGQDVVFKWEPLVYFQKKYHPIEEGVYRIIVGWQVRRDGDSHKWTWEKSRTKEFSVSK